MRNWFGVRGAGQDAEGRRARSQAAWARAAKELDELVPRGAFSPFMTEDELLAARDAAQNSRVTELVNDMIRRRHMAALVTLADWQPQDGTDALVLAAGRVRELADLSATLAEVVGQQVRS
ncbi:MAG: hypothetical protein GX617_10215 [Lentisphaerae bacterium]|nr:hypothetical protein [Lentisphaerota bacterium]